MAPAYEQVARQLEPGVRVGPAGLVVTADEAGGRAQAAALTPLILRCRGMVMLLLSKIQLFKVRSHRCPGGLP